MTSGLVGMNGLFLFEVPSRKTVIYFQAQDESIGEY